MEEYLLVFLNVRICVVRCSRTLAKISWRWVSVATEHLAESITVPGTGSTSSYSTENATPIITDGARPTETKTTRN